MPIFDLDGLHRPTTCIECTMWNECEAKVWFCEDCENACILDGDECGNPGCINFGQMVCECHCCNEEEE